MSDCLLKLPWSSPTYHTNWVDALTTAKRRPGIMKPHSRRNTGEITFQQASLLKRNARCDGVHYDMPLQYPPYTQIRRGSLLDFAEEKGQLGISQLLKEHGCVSTKSVQPVYTHAHMMRALRMT